LAEVRPLLLTHDLLKATDDVLSFRLFGLELRYQILILDRTSHLIETRLLGF